MGSQIRTILCKPYYIFTWCVASSRASKLHTESRLNRSFLETFWRLLNRLIKKRFWRNTFLGVLLYAMLYIHLFITPCTKACNHTFHPLLLQEHGILKGKPMWKEKQQVLETRKISNKSRRFQDGNLHIKSNVILCKLLNYIVADSVSLTQSNMQQKYAWNKLKILSKKVLTQAYF